jgi:hypothetical protein
MSLSVRLKFEVLIVHLKFEVMIVEACTQVCVPKRSLQEAAEVKCAF